jgi:polysaccharide biosynthesis protein PslH
MKILMISSTFPYPPSKGETEVRTFNLLKYLYQRHEICLVTQRSEDVTDGEVEELQEWVQELVIFPQPSEPQTEGGLLNMAKRFGAFVQQGTPPNVLSTYSSTMQEWVDEAVKTEQFDVITCEHSINEIYLRPEWSQQMATVLNVHSSMSRINSSELGLEAQINLPLLRRYEQQYCNKFSAIVAVTSEDRRQLKTLNPDAKITVVPNGVDLNLFPKRTSNRGGQWILLSGAMNKTSIVDAARFFSLEVFPEIRKRYPEASLELVGGPLVPQISELAEISGVKVKGFVRSLLEYLHWATVCVMPVKVSGNKIKVLEAMAAGVPVVASDPALEDLTVDGAGVPLRAMRANEVQEYVYAIGRLFEEPKLREKLSENGRSLVESEYTWERVAQRYEQVLLDTLTNYV